MDINDNGDEFDSFFGAAKGKKYQAKSTKFSDPMEDLFGLDDSKEGAEAKTPAARSLGPKQTAQEDNDDLGFDPRKPKSTMAKSRNLWDDLLSPHETKRPQTSAAAPSARAPGISRQSTDTTTDTSNQPQPRPKTSQGRRSSNMSSTQQNPDPLGLFKKDTHKDNKEKDKEAAAAAQPGTSASSTPKPKKRGTTADWLGLSAEPQAEPEPPKPQQRPETPKYSNTPANASDDAAEVLRITDSSQFEEFEEHASHVPKHAKDLATEQQQQQQPPDNTANNIMLMNSLNLEVKQGFAALQYQEQQLMLASQMKQQEKTLMDMQRKQETLLLHQERQFQALVQQQMKRHQQLEELISQQQQRINTHLHLMMTSPPQMPAADHHFETQDSPFVEAAANDAANDMGMGGSETEQRFLGQGRQRTAGMQLLQLEADNKRLELENLRLEELVANTKGNYDKEIELLEKSYKKQIEVLENHLDKLEKRLKSEIEELQNFFQQKISVLEQDKQSSKKSYEEALSLLKQDHEDEIRKLRKNQEEDLELLKEEHRRMLDGIRQAKMLEFATLQENGSYLECLKSASSNLTELSGGLSDLKEHMQQRLETLQLEREKKVEARERRVEDAEKRMKIVEEANEAEKQRLMELVATLELQMGKMSKDSAEENWQLRQKLASLDAEKAAFAKEREFYHEQMLKDEERLKYLKEQQLLETQHMQGHLQEQRAQLHMERSKFELEKRLHGSTGLQKERMEIEAALQVAQDAARKADQERERFYTMQRQLEAQKRELAEKEHALGSKEEELHQELFSFRLADRLSQETQQRAKMAEQFFKNKIQMLQQKTQELAEKESSLSQERLILVQDRMSLEALKSKLSKQKKCSLCQLTQNSRDLLEAKAERPLAENQAASVTENFIRDGDMVERLLDANIADSLRKMGASPNGIQWEMLLDDDHKKMAAKKTNADGGEI